MSDNTEDRSLRRQEDAARDAESADRKLKDLAARIQTLSEEKRRAEARQLARLQAQDGHNPSDNEPQRIGQTEGPALQQTDGATPPEQVGPQLPEQTRAFGERAMAERAESGPEKKDRDLFQANRRLREGQPPSHGGGENKG